MNMWLKSIFVMVYMMGANGASIYCAYRLYSGGLDIGWAGALAANLPGALFFNYVMATKRVARTSLNMPLISTLTFTGALLSVIGWTNAPDSHGLALLLGGAGLVGWFLYNYWYSSFGARNTDKLAVGSLLPEFTLEDNAGNSVGSGQFRGRPALFLFYRGNWCPLCMAQVREIAGQYRELANSGAQTVLVSPQPHGHTRKLAAQYDVPFTYLTDPGNKVAENLDIAVRNGIPLGMQAMGYDSDTVMPTVVITDAEGRIVFADLTDNYRVRPEPETFLRVLESLQG